VAGRQKDRQQRSRQRAEIGKSIRQGNQRCSGNELPFIPAAFCRFALWPIVFLFAFIPTCFNSLDAAPSWQTNEGYRRRGVAVPETGKTGFTLLTGSGTGILFYQCAR
jgi:hypothetical protein